MKGSASRLAVLAISIFVLNALSACGQRAEEAACIDTVGVLADVLQRCGAVQPRSLLEDEVEDSVTMSMGCGRVVEIRDEVELREVCFPALDAADCADVMAGTLDPSCRAQIVVRVR